MQRAHHKLEYHRHTARAKFHWKKWTARASAVLLAAAMGIIIFVELPTIRHTWYQQQCLIYEGDPKVAVFDSRPSALARYARSGDGWSNSVYSFYRRSRTIGTIPYVYYMPPQLEHFLALTPRAVAFMHLRVSPSGNQRLVIVTAEAGSGVYVLVIEPTTLTATSHPHFGVLGPYGKAGMQYLSTLGVAVFNGQFDRLHSDHFTIPYQVGDVNFVVDGWLQNDDSIRMVDSGLTPTSQPSPASAH